MLSPVSEGGQVRVRVFPYENTFTAEIGTPDVEFILSPTPPRSQAALPAPELGLTSLTVGRLAIVWGLHEILRLWETGDAWLCLP